MVVAYGMIGASLSGVTFMSVPGWVGDTQFSYMMVVLGYLFGYFVIATVLMPLFYRLNLTSIYSYLEGRFGFWSYKTGAFFFLLSRTIGASFRMFLVVNVLQVFVFDAWGIPFTVTTLIFIILILLYTFKGGIKTIIWTDTVQTTFMLTALVLTIYLITKNLGLDFRQMFNSVWDSEYSKMIFGDWHDKRFYLKQLLSGAFIAIVMTGLDQEMMQKNLSCRTLKDAQKNMFSFSLVLVFVNFLFLFLGAAIYLFTSI
jgi:Na+/proline symporter